MNVFHNRAQGYVSLTNQTVKVKRSDYTFKGLLQVRFSIGFVNLNNRSVVQDQCDLGITDNNNFLVSRSTFW